MPGLLEGEELKGNIGSVGKYSVDVTPELKLKVSVSAEVDLVAELKTLAAKTATPLDDKAIAWVEGMLTAAKAIGA